MNYAILELPPDAPIEDVKKAYKRLALKYHPDKNPGTEEQFKRISEAYQAIIEPQEIVPPSSHNDASHDIFQHFFSQMHPHPFFVYPGFNVNTGVNVNTGFNQGFVHMQPGIIHTQHSTSFQDGKRIEVIVQTENGHTITKKIITDLETNAVTIE